MPVMPPMPPFDFDFELPALDALGPALDGLGPVLAGIGPALDALGPIGPGPVGPGPIGWGQRYQRGQESLERRAWARAADSFTQVIEAQNSTRVDAALYWRAYALDKLNQQADALASLQDLFKRFPQSRWLSDAKALELQVRQNAGQPPRPENESDEELKLLALQGLQHSDPEQAVPMLEKLLQGTASPRLKARALFVLAQSNSPRARQVLTAAAKGASRPRRTLRKYRSCGRKRCVSSAPWAPAKSSGRCIRRSRPLK
jgi:tetratricopeptide (TPR) repeat protein